MTGEARTSHCSPRDPRAEAMSLATGAHPRVLGKCLDQSLTLRNRDGTENIQISVESLEKENSSNPRPTFPCGSLMELGSCWAHWVCPRLPRYPHPCSSPGSCHSPSSLLPGLWPRSGSEPPPHKTAAISRYRKCVSIQNKKELFSNLENNLSMFQNLNI